MYLLSLRNLIRLIFKLGTPPGAPQTYTGGPSIADMGCWEIRPYVKIKPPKYANNSGPFLGKSPGVITHACLFQIPALLCFYWVKENMLILLISL